MTGHPEVAFSHRTLFFEILFAAEASAKQKQPETEVQVVQGLDKLNSDRRYSLLKKFRVWVRF